MIKGMTLTNRGNKLTLIVGLALGLVAAVLTFVYLSGAGDSGSGSKSSSGGNVPVVVVNREVGPGTRITADMVAVKNVAASDALAGVFNNADAVVNQITIVKLVAGEQVIASKVTGNDQALKLFGDNPPLSLLLQPGMRGVSVEVSSVIAAGGLIRPGDHVDVILSVKTKGGEQGGQNQVAATILQNLTVIAIGQTVSTAAKTGSVDTSKKGDEAATTVTLAATPIQSEVLALADTCRLNFDGRLALAVRSLGDAAPFTPRSEWPSDGRTPDCASLLGITQLPSNNFFQ